MATYTTSVPMSNSTDAMFRLWVQAIDTALTTLGWVQTSDTGQISDLTTMLKPAATGTAVGYRIYRMNDSLQSTVPWFIKLIVGSTSGGQTSPSINLQAGSGTNGAGTLTGITSTARVNDAGGANNSTNYFNCYFSGDSGRFTGYMWANSGGAVVWNFSRTVNSSFVRTDEALITMYSSNSLAGAVQLLGKAGGNIGTPAAIAAATWSGMMPLGQANCSGADAFGIYPYVPTAGKPYTPTFDFGVMTTSDLGVAASIPFTVGSTTYRWILSSVVISGVYVYAMRYD